MATALERHVVGRRAGAAALLARGLGQLPGQTAPYWPRALRQEVSVKDVDEAKVPYFIAGTAYTCPFNLSGHPVAILPLARSAAGRPIGVQVVGKRRSEPALLQLAKKLALITGSFTPPPAFRD